MRQDFTTYMSEPRPNASSTASQGLEELGKSINSQGLLDLLFFGSSDPSGLRGALLLVLYVVLCAALALGAGRLMRSIVSSRGRHRQTITSRWLRAIVIAEILIFLSGTAMAIRAWSTSASNIGLLAGLLGLGALVIGFRRAIDNAVAGMMFSVRGSIRHGDSIEVSKVRGTVHQIALTHTQLSGIDGSMYWIPNRMLSQSILRIGKIKNVTIITVPLPPDLSREFCEQLRLRAYLCPYRRANSPVRIVEREAGTPKLELQTWAMRDGTRATAHLESWVEHALVQIKQSQKVEQSAAS